MGNWFSGVKIEDLDYFDAVVDEFSKNEKYLKTKDDFDSIIYDMTQNDDIKKIIKKGKKAYDYYSARPDIVDRKRKQKYLDKFLELEKKFSKDFQTYMSQKKRQTQGQTTKRKTQGQTQGSKQPKTQGQAQRHAQGQARRQTQGSKQRQTQKQ